MLLAQEGRCHGHRAQGTVRQMLLGTGHRMPGAVGTGRPVLLGTGHRMPGAIGSAAGALELRRSCFLQALAALLYRSLEGCGSGSE